MGFIRGFRTRTKLLYYGRDTPKEFVLSYLDRIIRGLTGKKSGFYTKAKERKFLKGECYALNDVKLPILDYEYALNLFESVLYDTFWSYLYCDDKYDEETFDRCDKFLSDGLYGLVNDRVNVTVQPGDIVIDAGAWIGDFAAYASVKGATTYAFEPTPKTYEYLCITAKLNGNIIPVNKGLSDENTNAALFFSMDLGSGGGNTLMAKSGSSYESSVTVESVRLDDFIRENSIPRVDFIKCDIEGFERHMLAGAQETLARFAPKLALCTYHLPDDPQVMAALIKQANPRYNIVQKNMKLFASVPQD